LPPRESGARESGATLRAAAHGSGRTSGGSQEAVAPEQERAVPRQDSRWLQEFPCAGADSRTRGTKCFFAEEKSPANVSQGPASLEKCPASLSPEPADHEKSPACHPPEPAKYEKLPADRSPGPADDEKSPASHSPEPARHEKPPASHPPEPARHEKSPASHRPGPARHEKSPASHPPRSEIRCHPFRHEVYGSDGTLEERAAP
jgi:hypothetical protein